MKTLFSIGSETDVPAQCSLLLEIGRDHCCYAAWHKPSNTVHYLHYASFNEREADASLANLLQQAAQQSYADVQVCWAYPQAVLVPFRYYSNEHRFVDRLYDEPAQHYLHDRIAAWQVVVSYAVPHAAHNRVKAAFSNASFCHAYTPAIQVYNGFVADNQLMVHLTPRYFTVVLKKEAALQLVQTYSYASPLDVVYYLLSIRYAFALDPGATYLILSGLLEQQSNLYTELSQYFAQVHFSHPPEIKLPDTEHPAHFFASLYNLAACVS